MLPKFRLVLLVLETMPAVSVKNAAALNTLAMMMRAIPANDHRRQREWLAQLRYSIAKKGKQ